jgi:hypothetical protein
MALTFDSVDDIAQNLNGIAILDSSDWTMAGWIKTSNDGETGAGAIIAIQSLDTSRCVMGFTNGRPGAIQAFDNGATDATATTTDTDFSDNAWRLVVSTFNAATGRCAVFSGTESANVAAEALFGDVTLVTKVTGSDRISIGNRNAGANTFGGSLARVGVWSKTLSLTEMERLRSGVVPRDRCERFWPLGDNGAASSQEVIGGFNLTITGATDAAGPSLPFDVQPLGVSYPHNSMATRG